MVGTTIAQFTAIEVKSKKGSVRPEQQHFINVVNDAGGYGLILRDPDYFKKGLTE